jgi:hypothetical protein
MHLNTGELVDIAEGTRPEASAPHLAGCEPCRAQLNELRAMMSAARDVDVPEPSPLFWDHLSSRVREAVAAEAVPRRSWLNVASWRRGVLDPLLAVGAVGLLIAVLLPGMRAPAPSPIAPPAVSVAEAGAATELLSDVSSEDDPSLTLVASLTDDADLDTVREAGLAPRGSAEHAITHMSESELRELGRLLKEELTRSGA